ncbi:MAG TPA: ubiquinol oxidase subunit II [Acetobacteraceae bacterium]|nr:ubiquinol oxidase subunit II [Acetobacteraceae bacterium]
MNGHQPARKYPSKYAHILRIAVGAVALAVPTLSLGGCSRGLVLLHPLNPIGATEKSVILIAFGLMMIVVIPVFVMTLLFAARYRATNGKARYAPKWDRSLGIELMVWLVPALIVTGLGILSWGTTHALNPYRPLNSAEAPIDIDVVAMNWKWLFIYPRQEIAAVNELVLPRGVPARFRLTSETVMTAFFIPRLGTMIYAMPGMRTKLNLVADKIGAYSGRNYQYSGAGYSGMTFKVLVTSRKRFASWMGRVRHSSQRLDGTSLRRLARPSLHNPVRWYSAVPPHLFKSIIGDVLAEGTGHGKPRAGKGV